MPLFKRGNVWWYSFFFAGQLVRESSRSTSKTIAKSAEQERRRELEAGYNNVKEVRQNRIRTLAEIIVEYLVGYRLRYRSASFAEYALGHVSRLLGSKLVVDINEAAVLGYPAETTEAFLDAHVHAFDYFGGVPTRILYDNTKLAVARILGNGGRKKTQAFSELQSHYLFAEKFGRPAKGNDKGNVEGIVGYVRRNFMVPIPCFSSWDTFNVYLEQQCRKRRERRIRGHAETIGERFERDRAAFLPLPPTPFEACEKVTVRVSSLSLVRYRANDYSVPTEYGHRQVLLKGYVHSVEIACGSQVIATHQRSYEREDAIYDPLHYLGLLEQKSRALDQAAPLTKWQLPSCFADLRRLIEARLVKQASREYIQVLRLLENFALDEVTAAVEAALRLRSISFDAVRHLLLCRIERRPPRLDMVNWPHLPMASVRTTQASDYTSLLAHPAPQSNLEAAL